MRVVVDTNVVFEGLTKQGGAAGLLIDSWLADLLEVYISNALASEMLNDKKKGNKQAEIIVKSA